MSTHSDSSEDSIEHQSFGNSFITTTRNQNLDLGLQSLEANSTQAQRPAYFYVLLEGRVLRLHADYLSRCSLVLDGMFNLPASGAGEGSCLENPLVLDSYAPPEQWKAFIAFIYPQHHSAAPVVFAKTHWLSLLAFSHKFDAPWALKQAKLALETDPVEPLSALQKLYLGRLYDFEDWVHSAAPQIVRTPISTFSIEDFALLGAPTVHLLISHHELLNVHRQRLAISLPLRLSLHPSACAIQSACTSAWRNTCDQITSALFRSNPISEAMILDLFRGREFEAAAMSHMSPVCVDRVMHAAEIGLVGRDELLIAKTVLAIKDL
ncbi:hypothetical protein BDV93DRAFT_564640 [Ceratobasidium sp. AG-I]|nr:hypothetical protein BDV93DRAFT_564640 [Ceratobasidium sp. AG-I]